ncbi:MAG: hypothetical protein ACYC7D_12660 [Nitrososphaerales archaeon]
MKRFFNGKKAVSNTILSAAVIILIVAAASGFGLYATTASKTTTSLNTVTVTTTNVRTEMMTAGMMNHTTSEPMSNITYAYQFNGSSGSMISSAWLLDVPVGMHEYAVSVHAEGLEPNETYILEGDLASGSMAVVPISTQSMNMNTTSASEFQTNGNGTGNYWIVLGSCPSTTFESIQLLYLPGMEMQNASTVATIHFGSSMVTSSETVMATS